jgi:hypothetical protein
VPDRSPFLTVHRQERELSKKGETLEIYWPYNVSSKISQTIEAFQERSGPVNEQERLGMFESELSNALERIVKNGHGKFTVLSRSPIKNEKITVGKF